MLAVEQVYLRNAGRRRIEREQRLWELWDAARDAHPLYEVVTHTDWFFPDEIKWKG